MTTSKLNLPIWNNNSKSVNRVGAARAKAYKTAADIVKSIPDTTAEDLQVIMDKMLAPGSIKSLEEFYELTGVGNPNPTKSENEANLNKSGITVVNGSNFFELSDSENVEAIRMLYIAGMSLSNIRKTISSLKEGDVFCLKCGKKVQKYPKLEYTELLQKYPSVRAYQEYLTNIENYTYVVSDTLNGNDSLFIVYVDPDSNNKAFLSCSEISFPVKGTFSIVIDKEYSYSIDAQDSITLISQINEVNAPITIEYNNGLSFTCDSSFYFRKSDLLVDLKIKDALYQMKESISLGYSGAEIFDKSESPYNILIKKPTANKSNTRKIYKSLKDNQVPDDICNSYLTGDSLYKGVESRSNALRDLIADNGTNELISSYMDSLYSSANIRILGTTRQTINRILKLSDKDLEYLLRYRTDVVGINPYVSNEEARDALIGKALYSSSGSYYSKLTTETDAWKQNTANARTAQVYVNISVSQRDDFNRKNWLDETYEFLDGVVYYYNKEQWSNRGTYYSEETLGTNIATSVNWSASFSFAHGLQAFAGIRSKINTKYLDEFEEDMMIIQAYLDAALYAFQEICAKLGKIIHILNSSISVGGNVGAGIGLDGGSLLQCSLSVDLSLNIPLYLPSLNDILLKLIEKLESIIQAIIDLENAILCPIQNLLDKYVNTSNFVLPCKISYKVPLISGIDAYLKAYLDALAGLKLMCRTSKRDGDWLKYKASMLPGSLNLLVTTSADCKES